MSSGEVQMELLIQSYIGMARGVDRYGTWDTSSNHWAEGDTITNVYFNIWGVVAVTGGDSSPMQHFLERFSSLIEVDLVSMWAGSARNGTAVSGMQQCPLDI